MGKRYSSSQALFAFGPHQTNFQTIVAPTSSPKNYRQIVKDGYGFATFDSSSLDNGGQSTGFAQPDEYYPDRDLTSFEATEQLTFQLAGIRAFDALGTVEVETILAPSGGNPGVYKHTFNLIDPTVSAVLPSRPLVIKGGGEPAISANQIYDALMPSMTYNTFSLSTEGTLPNLQLSSTWQGSGQFTEPSGVAFTGGSRNVWMKGDLGADHKTNINKRGGVVEFYPEEAYGGTLIPTTCNVRSFTTTVNENLDVDGGYGICGLYQDDDPENGAIADKLDSRGQTVDATVVSEADSDFIADFDITERIKKKTPFSMKVVYTGPTIISSHVHQMTLLYNKATITGHDYPDLGGKRGLSLTLGLQPDGATAPFTIELITNVANFATYMGA